MSRSKCLGEILVSGAVWDARPSQGGRPAAAGLGEIVVSGHLWCGNAFGGWANGLISANACEQSGDMPAIGQA